MLAFIANQSGLFASDAVPSAAELRDRFASNAKLIQNFTEQTTWHEFSEGRPQATEKASRQQDDIGRYRLSIERLEGNGEDPTESGLPTRQWRLFDGELFVMFDESHNPYDLYSGPNLPQEIKDLQAQNPGGSKPADFKVYPMAYVYDGEIRLSNPVESVRTPLTFMQNMLTWALDAAIKEDPQIKLTIENDDSKVKNGITVRWDFQSVDNEATIDRDRGWSVLSVVSKDSQGRQLSVATADYTEVNPGLWVATKGGIKKWLPDKTDGPPFMDWEFESQLKINDPEFDETTAFALKLEPGTTVFDDRYKVWYKIGEEPAFAEDLVALAEKEKASGKARITRKANEPLPSSSGSKVWLVIANCVALILIIAIVIFRRMRNRKVR